MPIAFDPGALLDIAGRLGLIDAVKSKPLRQPDAAADKLVTVLGEHSKIRLQSTAHFYSMKEA